MISLIHSRGSVTVQYPSLEEYEQPPSKYVIGWAKPNYPMPAIHVQCGYQQRGMNECKDLAYVYVVSFRLLWTFRKGLGLVVETR